MSRGFYTLFYKEVLRFHKVILQTVIAPAITTLLYLLVFSHALEQHVTVFGDVAYTTFLVPGLVMMTVIQNAFSNSSSSLIQSKITGNIIFILLTPLSQLEFYLAFVLAAVARGLVVGMAVYLCAAPFVHLPLHSAVTIVAFAVLGSAVLGTLGVIAGIWAEKFDQLAGFQNFIIVPLSFLSGVFYSLGSLPDFWQHVSMLNPFFYMIDGFRYGFIGRSDIAPGLSLAVVAGTFLLLSSLTLALLRRGYRLRN
jgi:ABC-2 type transport system permease protein